MEDTEAPDPDAVMRRLKELGVPYPLLADALRQGQLQGDFCTVSHPRPYQGMVIWGETNAALRQPLGALGWGFKDDDNIPMATSPDGGVVITAISGNENTGLRDKRASTRHPRRAAGVRIVRRNAQIEIVELLPEGQRGDRLASVAAGKTWFLLYYRDEDTLRSELSLARAVTDGGTLIEWAERLVLPEINLLDEPDNRNGDGDAGDPVVVPVEPRAH